jgi:hypothetical protein
MRVAVDIERNFDIRADINLTKVFNHLKEFFKLKLSQFCTISYLI